VGVTSSREVDEYLANLEQPHRGTLEQLRQAIRTIAPDAEETISYGLPAFQVRGKVIAGFAAFKNHLSYLPHSGSVLSRLGDDVAGYKTSKGALQFAVNRPLSKALVKKLITARLEEIPK
jgi:uncharacterized protein YdhG (YjbR/CyaY superfamily)